MVEKAESRYLFYLKAIAIFCVVCAHVAPVPDASGIANRVCSRFLDCLGTMGVPILFMISGYFYEKNKDSFGVFWKKKAVTIVIPWVICETIVWFYVVIRKGGISLLNWIKFIVGITSTTYYLTILLIFFLLLWKIRKNQILMLLGVIISMIGLLFTALDYPPMVQLSSLVSTPYLNPFHWLGYFCFGILCSQRTTLLNLGRTCGKIFWFTGSLLAVSILCHIYYHLDYSYFSSFAIPNIILSSCTIMGITYHLRDKTCNILLQLGKDSYTVYLVHQLLAGMIVWLTSKADFFALTLMRPFVVIVLIMIGLNILRRLSDAVGGKLKWFYPLIGIRQ